MKGFSILQLTLSGLLIAVGVVIPMVSPLKIVLEPASFTLASHVAIFIAMFISPRITASVVIGTAIGFFLGGFPIVVVFRAASHIIFAMLGALYLNKARKDDISIVKLRVFSFIIALIHASGELIIVSVFYFGGIMNTPYYQNGFITSVLLLVGLGTVIHSIVDFEIAQVIMLPLKDILIRYSTFAYRKS